MPQKLFRPQLLLAVFLASFYFRVKLAPYSTGKLLRRFEAIRAFLLGLNPVASYEIRPFDNGGVAQLEG
jgi:hypothetical protein